MTAIEQALWRRVVETASGCWEWTGYKNSAGYGLVRISGKTYIVHRAAYEHMVAPIPNGLHLDHLCRNRACVNPSHLDPVPPAVNLARSDLSPATQNKRKTHCPVGHPYDDTNTYVWRGERSCTACMRASTRAWRDRERGGPPAPYGAAKTHCVNGHEFTPENTGKKSNGGRRCRACAREYAARKRQEHAV